MFGASCTNPVLVCEGPDINSLSCQHPAGGGVGDENDDYWLVGDSISWPTAARLDGVFGIGVGGTGYFVGQFPADIQVELALISYEPIEPTTLLVITGGNDLASGYSIDQINAAAKNFHDTYEARGFDVRFITEPIPDNGNAIWNNLYHHISFLMSEFPDTIDCGPAGHPTETGGNYPVHPTIEGYDNYAACIQPFVK